MDFEIQPLSLQQTNWPALISLYTRLFDTSPTRVLDENNIPLDKPLTTHFVGSAESHLFFAIVGTCSQDILLDISNNTQISLLCKESVEARNVFIFIASASVHTWRTGLTELCNNRQRKLTRSFGNKCLSYLEMAGFNLNFTRVVHPDGTFTIS